MAGTGARTRITKDPDVRRDELLDIALQLCRSDGFEAMSVEQVTRAAGVAKGTFYHYFASKDAMLEELVGRFGEALFDYLSAAAATGSGSGADRIRALMAAAGGYKLAQADITYATFLYASGNLPLRHRLFAAWRERAREVLLPAIREGQADGSLSVASVEATTDIVLLLWFEAADQLWMRALAATDVEAFIDVMVSGATAIYQAQERILGIPDGTYAVPVGPQVIEMTRQLYHSLDRKQS
nr:TetR/AcrR family transcriptional regulator [Propionicimonas sp.]